MRYKKILAAVSVTAGCFFSAQPVMAGTICSGCEVIDTSAGTYLGLFNPLTFDNATFTHTDIQTNVGQDTAFNDFLLFDLNPAGGGSISADFTVFSAINDFVGALWSDGGSTCGSAPVAPSGCSAVVPGAKLFEVADAGTGRWEIVSSGLAAGRYIIQVTGSTRTSGPSSYSGQLSFGSDAQIPIPSSLALVLLGLLGVRGFSLQRKRQ